MSESFLLVVSRDTQLKCLIGADILSPLHGLQHFSLLPDAASN